MKKIGFSLGVTRSGGGGGEGAGSAPITITSAIFTAGSAGTGPSLAVTVSYAGSRTLTLHGASITNPSTPTEAQLLDGTGGGILEDFSFVVSTPSDSDPVTLTATSNAADEIHFVITEDGASPETSAIEVVTGVVIDGTAPTITSPGSTDVAGDTITLPATENMFYDTPVVGDFVLSGAGANSRTITSVTGSGTSNIVLELSGAVTPSLALELAYTNTSTNLRDASGNQLADFSGLTITNNLSAFEVGTAFTGISTNATTDPWAPTVDLSALVAGDNLFVMYGTLDGIPRLTIDGVHMIPIANYDGGSGTKFRLFRHTMQSAGSATTAFSLDHKGAIGSHVMAGVYIRGGILDDFDSHASSTAGGDFTANLSVTPTNADNAILAITESAYAVIISPDTFTWDGALTELDRHGLASGGSVTTAYANDVAVSAFTDFGSSSFTPPAFISGALLAASVKPAVAGFDVLSVGPYAWFDASDLSTMWTDTIGGTNVASDGDAVKAWEDKSGNKNHLTQASTGNWTYRTDGTHHWVETGSALTQILRTPSIELGPDTDFYAAFKEESTLTTGNIIGVSNTSFSEGVVADGDASAPRGGFTGSPTYRVNGASAGTTRDNLHDSWFTNTDMVIGLDGLNLYHATVFNDGFRPFSYPLASFCTKARVYEMVLCPGIASGTTQTNLETHLALAYS